MLRQATSPTRRNVVLGALVAVAAAFLPATVVVAEDQSADATGVATAAVDGAIVAVVAPPVPPAEEVAVGLPPVPPAEEVAVGLPPVPPAEQVAVGTPPVPPSEVVAVGKPPVPARRSTSQQVSVTAPVIAADLGAASHAVFELIGL